MDRYVVCISRHGWPETRCVPPSPEGWPDRVLSPLAAAEVLDQSLADVVALIKSRTLRTVIVNGLLWLPEADVQAFAAGGRGS